MSIWLLVGTIERYGVVVVSGSVTDTRIQSPKTRDALINWLTFNDRNGTYKDADCLIEFGEVLSLNCLQWCFDEVNDQLQPCVCGGDYWMGHYCAKCGREYNNNER